MRLYLETSGFCGALLCWQHAQNLAHKMRLIVKAISRAMERAPLPQALVDWLMSEPGQMAVADTVQKSQIEVKSLNDARRVKPEQLHVPITL